MLRKCANPMCLASFRKLGSGKLFAFESVMTASSVEVPSNPGNAKAGQAPVCFWLCATCSLTFTVRLDTAGNLALLRIGDCSTVPIVDRWWLDQAG